VRDRVFVQSVFSESFFPLAEAVSREVPHGSVAALCACESSQG
jgi:hypothetical protein